MAARNYLVVQGLIRNINTYIFLYQFHLVFKPLSCIESLHIQEKNSLQKWNTTTSWHGGQNTWYLTGPFLVYIISFGSLKYRSSALIYIYIYMCVCVCVCVYTYTHTHTHTHTYCYLTAIQDFEYSSLLHHIHTQILCKNVRKATIRRPQTILSGSVYK